MKKILIVLLACSMFAFVGCGADADATSEQEASIYMETLISANLVKCVSLSSVASSNPFDYMNNTYYQSIKDLGEPAIPALLEGHEKGRYDGVEDYLAMYLVWDISGNTDAAELKNCENADQMYEAWKKFNK